MMKTISVLPNWRNALAFIHDIAAAALAWTIAYLLRFNLDIPSEFVGAMGRNTLWLIPGQATIFLLCGMYRGLWRYASLADLRRIFLSAGFGVMIIVVAVVMFRLPNVPRSVIVLYPVLLSVIMGGSRIVYRTIREGGFRRVVLSDAKPVLIVGSGDVAERLIRELRGKPDWQIVGLLDDDRSKHGRHIHGIRVLGNIDRMQALAGELEISHVILAIPSADYSERRKVIALASQVGLSMLTVPSLDELVSGRVTVSQIRQVALDDLLGRAPVVLDDSKLRPFLSARTVLVTGAGGSIGSELCRQIARFAPSKLVLLEMSEFALYSIEQEFRTQHPNIPIVCAVGDAKDAVRVSEVFLAHRPEVVFHAAAYKHVPLMEEHNAWQGVRNNVLATYVVADAARRHHAKKFVLISTDKAVNPTNVMGASKRLAEMICQAAQDTASTCFITVRFGNVLGSTGSVIPKFREQIAAGGPVTVTHPEITRYFMSIPEASQLVLQAGAMGEGGEIFVLDMGEPVRIVDLARDMIRLSGMHLDDIPIAFTGLRPGEKLHEELLAGEEHTLPTPYAKLRIARARDVATDIVGRLIQWVMDERSMTDDEVREQLRRYVPEYVSANTTPHVSDATASEVKRHAIARS